MTRDRADSLASLDGVVGRSLPTRWPLILGLTKNGIFRPCRRVRRDPPADRKMGHFLRPVVQSPGGVGGLRPLP